MDLNTASDSQPQETHTVDTAASALDDGIPQWVKEAGLEAAHNAAKPGTVVNNPPTAAPRAPVAQPPRPAAQPTAPAAQPLGAQPDPAAQTGQPTPPAQPPVAPAGLDPKTFVDAVRAVLPPQATQAEPSSAAQDAELARQLGIVTVTPEMYKSILGVDGQPEQITALNGFAQSVAKQATSISAVLIQQAVKSLREELAPYTGAVQASQAEKHKTTFFAKHPDLAGYGGLVEQQYTLLKASGKQFPNAEAAYAALAESTRATLQSLGITPKAAAGNGSQPNRPAAPPQTQRQMAPTSMGGRSGAAPAGKPSVHQSVWG